MEKKYFPIFIDISEKKIVVVGGGVIATRRVTTLLNFTEKLVVVAPELTNDLQKLYNQGSIEWLHEVYCITQIKNADIVIAATNLSDVNLQIKNDCHQIEREMGRKILVNVIDDKEKCDFYFPSIVESEEVVIGINSGGKSPGKTKRVRKQIEAILESNSIYE